MTDTDQLALFDLHRSAALAIARKIGRRLRRHPRQIDREGLEAAALVGLWDAAKRFRPEKGIFSHYFPIRVHGEVIEWLRKDQDYRRHQLELTGSAGHRRYHRKKGSPPKMIPLVELRPVDDDGIPQPSHFEQDRQPPVDHLMQAKDLVAVALAAVTRKQRRALELYYLGDLTLSEAGEQLGRTETNVCKLVNAGLARARKALAGREEEL
jgi:RNA polymerase sigma factor (sigma-70 family)